MKTKKRTKKMLILVLAVLMIFALVFAGCEKKEEAKDETKTTEPTTEKTEKTEETEETEEMMEEPEIPGFVDGKFEETRKITVELFDRGQDDGKTFPDQNPYADYIRDGMLEKYNVEVEFVLIPRWSEVDMLNNMLAANDAPDICVTYDYPTIYTYAQMGGVTDLAPLITEYRDYIDNIFDIITEENVWYDKTLDGKLWAIEGRVYHRTGQMTFIREDWINKLGLDMPTTHEEFEDVLYKFKENAETLLGDDADKIVPYLLTRDLGWGTKDLAPSFYPADMTMKTYFAYSFDDRDFTMPNYKEAVRLFNKWYNAGLTFDDFSLYEASSDEINALVKNGYVGAFAQNSNAPYQNGLEGDMGQMQQTLGDDTAAYVPIATFPNDEGNYMKYMGVPVDRKVFFPATNDETFASLLYLDWLHSDETRIFLQMGPEGIGHEREENGAYSSLSPTGEYRINAFINIDYTSLINGLWLDSEEITSLSMAGSTYPGIDPKYIEMSLDLTPYTVVYTPNFTAYVGEIESEQGMGEALAEKRTTILNQAVTASVEDFDAVFDAGMDDYLASGGQAIIDERIAKWEAAFGDSEDVVTD